MVGVWPKYANPTSVKALDCSKNRRLLATADDKQRVKLFRLPCNTSGSGAREFAGHASHVANVRFSADDNHVVSVGSRDQSVFVWRVVWDDAPAKAQDRPG